MYTYRYCLGPGLWCRSVMQTLRRLRQKDDKFKTGLGCRERGDLMTFCGRVNLGCLITMVWFIESLAHVIIFGLLKHDY